MTRNRLIASVALALLAYVGCVGKSFAGTFTARWINPTTYEDASTLPVADITRNRVEYGTCAGVDFGTKGGEFVSTGNDTSEVSPNLAPGTYCHRVFTTAKGVESLASNVKAIVIPQSAPRPPTLLDALLAWLRSVWGRFA